METTINSIINKVVTLFLEPIEVLLISISMIYFFWGLAIFILNSDEEGKRKEGRDHMLWGMVGLFIIFSVWGIINLINNSITTLL